MQQERDATWHSYLVEHYRSGSSVEALSRMLRDVQRSAAEMAGQGKRVRYLRSTIVPDDEAIMAVFEAASEGLVREACERAGLGAVRISHVLQPDEPFERSSHPSAGVLPFAPADSGGILLG